MVLDSQLCFTTASGQAISTATTTVGTDTLDLGANVRLPSGRISFIASAKAGTTPDLKCELFGDTAAGFGTEKSLGSRLIAAADLVAGKVYHLDVAPAAPYRYYRVKFTQSGNADNSATVHAFLVDEELVQTDILLAGVSTP